MALNEEQIGKVRQLLSSSAWNDVVRPVIANRANEALKALRLEPAERKGEYEGVDDVTIRARIREAEFMLGVWTNEISVYEHNRRLEELERHNNGAEAPA